MVTLQGSQSPRPNNPPRGVPAGVSPVLRNPAGPPCPRMSGTCARRPASPCQRAENAPSPPRLARHCRLTFPEPGKRARGLLASKAQIANGAARLPFATKAGLAKRQG